MMNPCPYCQATTKQRKIGRTKASSQRYQCLSCGRRYTPEPKVPGYDEQLHQQAVKLYSDGMNFRRIARHLGVSHQTVINWVNAYSAQLPNTPALPQQVGVVELDELYTFIGKKKTASTS
jgi:transposase-like protein